MNILLKLPNILTEEGLAKFNARTGFSMTPRGLRALGKRPSARSITM